MPQPMEICIEDLDPSQQDERFLRCVALPGGDPGLALDRAGQLRWMPAEPCPFGLWVSGDQQLVLLRGPGAAPLTVQRSGRRLQAPQEQPVILLDGDELQVGPRRLRVHVHGLTDDVSEPEPIPASAFRRMARAAATALSLGAAAVAGSAQAQTGAPHSAQSGPADVAPIEVRVRPPKPAPARRPVYCDVRQMTSSKGKVLVHAHCPKGARVYKGMRGQLVPSNSTTPIKDGVVVVNEVDKQKVVAESQLAKPRKGLRLKFMVRMW